MSRRLFHLDEETGSKFWSIEIAGADTRICHGFWMGMPLPETPDQTLTEVCFVAGLHSTGELPDELERLPLAAVDPVVRSEVLITVESLVSRAVS